MTSFAHADTAIAQAASSVSTISVTLANPVGVGDLVCVYFNAPTIASDVVSASPGIGTWVYPAAGSNFTRMAYCIVTTAQAGGTTITATGGGTSGHLSLVADRFAVSGGTVTFGGVANVAASGASGNLGSLSSVPAGALLWGALHSDTASSTFTAGSSNSVSCTIGSQTSNANGSIFSEYILSAAGGTESMTWTSSPGVSGLTGWEAYFIFSPIQYNTGTTANANGIPQATAFTFTIPAGVKVGDTMLVPLDCFTYTSSSPAISTPTSGGGSWQALSPGLVDGGAASGLNVYSSVWQRVATASDPGSTFTVSFTGTQGASNAFYWTAVLASYTGANAASPIDVVAHNGPAGVGTYPSQPTAVTNTTGDWSVVITTADVSSSGTISTSPATNRTQFNNPSSGCIGLSDSNGSVGAAGTTIGGAGDSFTYSGQGQGVQWTIGLAPAGGTPVYGYGLMMGIFP